MSFTVGLLNKVVAPGLGTCAVHVVNTLSDWAAVVQELQKDLATLPILGLDCEWVSQCGSCRPVALLQLATYRGLCVLVRLCLLPSLPTSLRSLLASQELYKVGGRDGR